jgi:predicted small secreted protein
MKRRLALAALLLAASACTATTENTNTGAGNTNANTNANSNAAASPTPAGVSQSDLEAKERAAYDAIKAKNWDAFGAMLAEEFVAVSEEGVEARAAMLEGMKKYELAEYTLSDFRMVRADADLAVITYTFNGKSTYDGKASPGKPERVSTAWVNRGGKWLAAYHQETDIAEAPAQGGGANTNSAGANTNANTNANSNANANTSGATPPAPASATEAETAVWEAIKRRDYTTFGNFLTPEALEVEPDKVYTKADSLEAIKMFDASKFTQSDFKETKLDADATLVTYTVSGPMMGKTVTEYHGTIWLNRGGQWRAAFHQGTRKQ